MGDIEHPWLRGYINETDLGKVKIGSKANVTTDSYPGKIYQGRVTFISSEAEFTPKQIQTQQEQLQAQEANLATQNQRLTLVETRYKTGVSSYLELLNAQRDSFASQQTLVMLKRQLLTSASTLFKALGGISEVP